MESNSRLTYQIHVGIALGKVNNKLSPERVVSQFRPLKAQPVLANQREARLSLTMPSHMYKKFDRIRYNSLRFARVRKDSLGFLRIP